MVCPMDLDVARETGVLGQVGPLLLAEKQQPSGQSLTVPVLSKFLVLRKATKYLYSRVMFEQKMLCSPCNICLLHQYMFKAAFMYCWPSWLRSLPLQYVAQV
jgi:hypothetical protein